MSKRLTHKEKGFAKDIADGIPGVHAALNNYDTKDYNTAAVIAHENLNKPKIKEYLKEQGFDSDNAKRVVAQILNSEYEEAKDKLKAADIIFKVNGNYAAEKHINVNVEVEANPEIEKAASILNEHFKGISQPSNGVTSHAVGEEAPNQE